jgi:hypothetical protein
MSQGFSAHRRCVGTIIAVVAAFGAFAPGALAKPHTPVGPAPTAAPAAPSGPRLAVSALSSTPAGALDVRQPDAVRGAKVTAPIQRNDETCSSGAHTLSKLGDHVYPEMGNGGYTSVHTDVNLVYDAIENNFLSGTNVTLTDLATECLTDFSLDFAPQTPDNEEEVEEDVFVTNPGADMQVQKVFVNGEEAAFAFVQPTYPGDPNGPNDPDPAAHQTGQDTPVSATNPLPPACTPESRAVAANGQACPARKLVVTPAAPLPSGEKFEVKVEYTGHPGIYTDGGGEGDGWFRSNSPAGDGAFVTTEPVGTEGWMPLNNHPSAKPTYDFTETVTKGRTAVANGELVKPSENELAEENEPDAQFPDGSTTWRWHSPEPIANYLVENSIGAYDLSERKGPEGTTYYEAQGSSIPRDKKELNQAVMDQQEDITHFQERFNGPFPFTTDGVVVAVPQASFEEEMQGKITFNGSEIGLNTFNHENMHQWWGDNVSESNFNETFFKEGMARLSEYLLAARTAATAAGGLDTPAGEAAFDASLVAQFHTNYIKTGTMWTRAPSNPTPVTLFSTATTYDRPATAYIALRQILGKANFAGALQQIQQDFRGGSIEEPQLEAEFRQAMPNQSPACRSRLSMFFGEWFDTEFPAAGGSSAIRPQLTGPGLDPSASGTTFYNADGTCKRVAPAPPVTTASILPAPVNGNVTGPATVTLTATDSSSGVASTQFKLDGATAFQTYVGPITVAALGSHKIEFRSTNRDGVVEAIKQVTFTVVAHDAPVTSASVSPQPVNGKVTGSATVVLAATENGGGVAGTEFKLDAGAFQPYTGPITVSSFGDHTIEYRSTNRDGVVEADKRVSFTVVAHDAPVTIASFVSAPVNGKVIGSATVALAARANGIGVLRTEFKLDAGVFQPYVGPITVSTLGDHTIEYRSTNDDGVVEAAKRIAFTVVAPPPPPAAKRICAEPHLFVAVTHPLHRRKGVATLLRGKAYRFTGQLTCGSARTPAPEGTAIKLSTVSGAHASALPGLTVGSGGRIDTLLQYASKRTVVFAFADGADSAQVSIRIAVARR